jgi:hypothetical protein
MLITSRHNDRLFTHLVHYFTIQYTRVQLKQMKIKIFHLLEGSQVSA